MARAPDGLASPHSRPHVPDAMTFDDLTPDERLASVIEVDRGRVPERSGR